jgi:spermidine synthase
LILRSGAGGMIDEILKHPSVRNVTYAEHDPAFLEEIRKFPTVLTEFELSDPRVRLQYRDGRLLLASSPQTYVISFIGVMEPSNLQSNRFFTREFFSLAQDRFNEGGILVLTVPGSLAFLSDELKNLNSTISRSMDDVFPFIRAIPGEHRNLYLARVPRRWRNWTWTSWCSKIRATRCSISRRYPGGSPVMSTARWWTVRRRSV